MPRAMKYLMGPWIVTDPLGFILILLLTTAAIRVAVVLLHFLEYGGRPEYSDGWRAVVRYCFTDRPSLISAILGTIELGVYPFLMVAGAWEVLGAWIAFKSVAQWHQWTRHRAPFNRYLIGTALVVICAYLFLAPYIVQGGK